MMKTRTKIAGSVLLAYSTGALVLYTLEKVLSTTFQAQSEFNTASEGTHHSRHLLQLEPNCSPAAVESFPKPFISETLAKQGAVVVYILIALYAFLSLAIITDSFFLASLERIVEALNINQDVAGATFMAAGSSAPELGTSLLAVFVTKDDIGVGTVVGSAVYNVAFVVALCGLFAGKVIYMSWWPLCRDCFFYLISIIALMVIMWDKTVEWPEALVLLLLYITYISFMYVNEKLENYFTKLPALACLKPRETKKDVSGLPSKHTLQVQITDSTENGNFAAVNSELCLNIPDLSNVFPTKKKAYNVTPYPENETESLENEKEEEESPLSFPDGTFKRLIWIVCLPALLLFTITIPNCKTEKWKNFFIVSFLISCVWISGLTYVLVWMITVIGAVWSIPDAVMGLTFLAAGASVPDTLASIFVAREGKGNMAISNAVGSNVFDILLCLGLPWFIQTAIVHPGSRVPVYAGGMIYTVVCLLATVVFLLLAAHINGWKLNKKLGFVMLFWYIIFMVFTILYQMNVFSKDNLPTCTK